MIDPGRVGSCNLFIKSLFRWVLISRFISTLISKPLTLIAEPPLFIYLYGLNPWPNVLFQIDRREIISAFKSAWDSTELTWGFWTGLIYLSWTRFINFFYFSFLTILTCQEFDSFCNLSFLLRFCTYVIIF